MKNNYFLYKDSKNPKVLIIGLDAVTWDILMPMVKGGEVPNIARLMSEGAYGDLESIDPMMSPVLWTSIATGKTPEKHGVTNFYSTQSSLKSYRIWEILAKFDKTIGIFEWLLTSPPKPLKEFIIPGWLATTSETFPPDLEFIKKLTFQGKREGNGLVSYFNLVIKGFKNGLRVSTVLRAFFLSLYLKFNRPDFYDVLYKKILMKHYIQQDIATYLLKRYQPDFSAIVFYATDQIPHHYWKFMEPRLFNGIPKRDIAKYGNVIRKAYQKADKAVCRIMESIPSDTTIIILSDHGMEAVTDVEYVFKTEEFLRYLNFSQRDKLQVQIIKNNLHIGLNVSEDHERDMLQKKLIDSLSEVVVESKGNLFDVSVDKYGNVKAEVNLKDLDFINSTVHFPPDKKVKFITLIETERLLSAKHSKKGILIMKGKDIARGKKLQPSSILDIAPTVLAIMGLPVERDMDGNVIKGAFTEEFLKNNPIKYIDSYTNFFGDAAVKKQEETKETLTEEDTNKIKDELKALGYLE